MRNVFFCVIVVSAVTITAFLSTSNSSSAQANTPIVSNPALSNEAMIKRIQELEKKVDQLQKEMAGAKLVAGGLDKSLAILKSAHETHTHKLVGSTYSFEQFRIDSANGKSLYAPIVNADQLKVNKGFVTTAPVK